MKKVLNQYHGHLSPSQVAAGMNAASANARRLAEDARMLFEAGRFPSAASLAILALEELGKSSILRSLITAKSKEEIEREWKRYRKHTEKNYMALISDRARNGARQLLAFRDLFTGDSEKDRMTYDTLKQLGFYTDCCGDAHWSIPTVVIDESLAKILTEMTSALTRDARATTAEEVELWRIHMGSGHTRENLLKWCSEMVASGLAPTDYTDEMRQFTEGIGQ